MPHVSQRTHAILDYVSALVLLLSPLFLPYPDHPTKLLAFTFGSVAALYSAFTDYELALLRVIPFGIHRGIDLLWGLGLLFAPVHFAVNGAPAVLFVALGLLAIVATFLTTGRFSTSGSDKPAAPGL